MSINAEPLRKILELECNKGYVDSAVIGGLDRFLRRWSGQAIESITNPQLLNRFHRLVNSSYASMTKQQRQEWVAAVFDFLAELERREEERTEVKLPPAASRLSSEARKQGMVVNQSIESPITVIKGVSSGLATKFNRLGVRTVRDLL